MPIQRIRDVRRGACDFLPSAICSTGAEEAAALAALEEGAALTGGVGAGAGLAGSSLAAGSSALPTLFSSLGVTPASLALQGAGLGVQALASNDAQARRTRINNAMSTYQKGLADQQTDLAGKYVDASTPAARQAGMDEATAENKLGFEKTVGAAQAFESAGEPAGKLSAQYRAAQANSADAASRRNKALIESLSRMRAPGVVQQREGIRYGRAAGDSAGLGMSSGAARTAGMTDIGNVVESPYADLAGGALTGLGQGLALKEALKQARLGV